MSLDDLFSKLDKRQQEINKQKQLENEAQKTAMEEKRRKKEEISKLQHEFQVYYANTFIKELSEINEKLQDKFILEYPPKIFLNKDDNFEVEIYVKSRKVYEFMPDQYIIKILAIAGENACFISHGQNKPALFTGSFKEFMNLIFREVVEKSIEQKAKGNMI